MNDTLQRLAELATEIKSLESQAVAHEQQARDCRAAREAKKLEQSELQRIVNDTKVVHAVESSLTAAQASQRAAEEAKTEAVALLDALRTKIAECDAKSSKLNDLIKKAETPAEPTT